MAEPAAPVVTVAAGKLIAAAYASLIVAFAMVAVASRQTKVEVTPNPDALRIPSKP